MKPLICAMLVGVLLGGATVGVEDAEAGGRKRPKHRGAHHEYRYDDDDRYERGSYFTHREVHVIREYYGPRYRRLPPGLRRHYYRRGYLPPGWQHRIEPYPVFMERDVIVVPRGYRRGLIDGHAVIYNSRGLILDIAVLF